ncbi:hypothetical protein CAEBREN_31592 [Caenorhabditis brenneri]|uniref:Uncharacterized protein n=1 Tax=Caenorhabditis brenneri TaxID=135651 RepID=G0P465_CAEBE|nr:hypothetical protein CAEBREN_31592 [Caenorhabditis brenneri]
MSVPPLVRMSVCLSVFMSGCLSVSLYVQMSLETISLAFQNDQNFDKLKTNLSKGFENTGFLDIFCPVHILQSKWLKWRQDAIFQPFDWVLELTKRNIKKRVDQIESGEHVLHDEPDDFLDAYLMKMQKDQREGVESTFT